MYVCDEKSCDTEKVDESKIAILTLDEFIRQKKEESIACDEKIVILEAFPGNYIPVQATTLSKLIELETFMSSYRKSEMFFF